MPEAVTLVWFRHDLRLDDNPALAAAAARGRVVPVFIWAPEEEAPWEPGAASRWWLHHSLEKLSASLAKAGTPLVIRRGPSLDALRALAKEYAATHVAWNRRYEPAVVKRDTIIKQALVADGLGAESFNGGLLFEPVHVKTKQGNPYQVFTPFWRALLTLPEPSEPVAAARKLTAAEPVKRAAGSLDVGELDLAGRGVRVERFLPASVPIYFAYANLRNHRKIMVVDGAVGFTGGLNIRDGCWLAHSPRHPVRDTHFRIRGPVVAHLLEVFVEDWAFAAEETLGGHAWKPSLAAAGSTIARGIRFGPDDPDIGRIKLVLAGALTAAQRSVRIMTPYFLPDDAVCQALDVAAARGVQVDIVLPEQNNLALVGWASTALLWQVLDRGCHVWMSPPPFEHTKLLVVDGAWAMFGSGNWDDRSMRLNFEFNVEVYDRDLAGRLDRQIADVIARSRAKTLAEVDARSLPVRLRDGVARLFAPYL